MISSSSLLFRRLISSRSFSIISSRRRFVQRSPSIFNLSSSSLNQSFKSPAPLIRMASGGAFPPQTQERQPGKEHVMDPTPHAASHDYKAANKLQGKVALVAGGDSGIGRAVCLCYVMEGAAVAFTYVKPQEDKDANDTLQLLKQAKSRDSKDPIAIPADLGFEQNCKSVVEQVVNAFGRIDVLVNNAAEQYVSTDLSEINEEQLDRVFRTNIFSHFLTTKYALKHMPEGGCCERGGTIPRGWGPPTWDANSAPPVPVFSMSTRAKKKN